MVNRASAVKNAARRFMVVWVLGARSLSPASVGGLSSEGSEGLLSWNPRAGTQKGLLSPALSSRGGKGEDLHLVEIKLSLIDLGFATLPLQCTAGGRF